MKYFGVLLVLAVVVLLARQEQFYYPPRITTFVRAPLGFPKQPGDTHPV